MDGRFTRRAALLGVTAAAGAIPPLRSVLAQPAAAESRVDITRARTDPIPIAVPALPGTRGAEIAQVIQNDLKNSGLFRPVQNAAFIQLSLIHI